MEHTLFKRSKLSRSGMSPKLTSCDIPYPHLALTPARDKQIGSGVVIDAKHIATVSF
jgi:hypothetical protein